MASHEIQDTARDEAAPRSVETRSVETGPILKRVVANAGLLLGGRTMTALLGLGYMALCARGLGVTQFGVLVLIHAFAQFLGDVVKFQSWQTVLQYGAKPLLEGRVADFQRVLRFTLVLDLASSVIGVGIGLVGAVAFADRLGWTAAYAPAAAGYVLSVAFMVSAAPLGLLRLFDRFDIMAKQTALIGLVRLAGSAVAFALHAPLQGYLLAWGLGPLAGFIYLATGSWRELDRRGLLTAFPWGGSLTAGMPGVWRFAWATNLSATVDVAFTHSMTLMVGGLLGAADAGMWRIGRQIADAIAKPATLLIPALYPELARLREAAGERTMWKLALQVGGVGGGVGLLLLGVSVFAGAPLLGLIMGPAFMAAAAVMTWQVAAAVIGIVELPMEPMLVSLGKAGATMRMKLGLSIAFLAILVPVVHRFGLIGAGAALVGSAVAQGLGMAWILLRRRQADLASKKTLAMTGPDA